MTINELLKHVNNTLKEVRQAIEEARKEERTGENKNTYQNDLEKLNAVINCITDTINNK